MAQKPGEAYSIYQVDRRCVTERIDQEVAPPLLFDVRVHRRASERLREEGIDVVHASDVGLADADDLTLLLSAAGKGWIEA